MEIPDFPKCPAGGASESERFSGAAAGRYTMQLRRRKETERCGNLSGVGCPLNLSRGKALFSAYFLMYGLETVSGNLPEKTRWWNLLDFYRGKCGGIIDFMRKILAYGRNCAIMKAYSRSGFTAVFRPPQTAENG